MGIPPGTTIADKTGDIGTLVGDAGIITTKNGQHYIAVVAVERPFNDRRANALIRQISKSVYVELTGDADGVKGLGEAPINKTAATASNKHRRHHHRHHK